jgi:hypothetical protein
LEIDLKRVFGQAENAVDFLTIQTRIDFFNKTTDQNLKEINFMENQNQEKSKPAHNNRSYCMPQKVVNIGNCAIYWHSARSQI